jgi:hypothetical protein
MGVAVNLLAILSEEIPAPAAPMEEIPITKVENIIHMKMDNMMKVFKPSTIGKSEQSE